MSRGVIITPDGLNRGWEGLGCNQMNPIIGRKNATLLCAARHQGRTTLLMHAVKTKDFTTDHRENG